MKLKEVISKLNLKALTDSDDRDVEGVYISDMLSDVMTHAKPANLWITVQNHKNVVSTANLIDISAVVIPLGKEVPQGTIELANRFNVIILSSPLSVFDLTNKCIEIGLK